MDIVSLFEDLVNGLLKAEEEFFSNPRDLYTLEKATKRRAARAPTGFNAPERFLAFQ